MTNAYKAGFTAALNGKFRASNGLPVAELKDFYAGYDAATDMATPEAVGMAKSYFRTGSL